MNDIFLIPFVSCKISLPRVCAVTQTSLAISNLGRQTLLSLSMSVVVFNEYSVINHGARNALHEKCRNQFGSSNIYCVYILYVYIYEYIPDYSLMGT